MTDVLGGESDPELKKIAKEVPVVQDHGCFVHDTGDTYEGLFEAKKKDRSVKMHGLGAYKTAEGDIYSGIWEHDRLGFSDIAHVLYTNGAKFEGLLKDWCYSGPGKYIYPDNSVLLCDFADNAPVGKLKLLDPNGHAWLGKSEVGFAWMEASSHYYDMLDKESKTKRRSTKCKDLKESDI
ncbi:unnamed protein product [Leptidea sinapis]|uniref:Uncharacterized protein n=1 Tax=Leptidea sinapis TaxID=189913 RepID=A0A5E4Q9M2_9NEOP|nr:unnamed protein product [Leptidea sinapis]